MLSDADLERYSRQVIMSQIGEAGQEKLAKSCVMICGMGGLGCPAAEYLALAGIGSLLLVDHDNVEISNLPRQALYEEADIGRPKVQVAAEKLSYLNPRCIVTPKMQRFDQTLAQGHAESCSLWIDATDNYAAREHIARLAQEQKRKLLTASVQGMQGHLTCIPGNPSKGCFHDIYPNPPDQQTVSQCEQVGILGAMAAMMGSLLAMEAIKETLEIGKGYEGRMLLYDGVFGRMQEYEILPKKQNCDICPHVK